ncbi:hypothetical protein FACS189481_0400 [Clostridia bacterium]|nr:hypothetical protein FACS189481_0400 [Clostridia bacterium]
MNNVAVNRLDSLSTQAKRAVFKISLGPEDKRYSHAEGFAASDGSVADDGILTAMW